ncbi:MAG TPA: hypothetical protein VFQ53_11150 [Kofleriaceae bacterium]|nr:hypothetical protein [Kofleriaceae bacterium]
MNRHYGRRDNFWSAEQCSVVQLMDVDAILEKLTYTFTNPVKHGAAYTIDRWPGVNGYANLMTGMPLKATRPVFFFRADETDLPDAVELHLKLPDVLGDKTVFLQRLKARVEARVMQLQAERALKGLSFVGRAALKRLTWEYKPPIKDEWVSGSMKALRNRIKPHFASKDVDNRIEAIQERRAFHAAYRKARAAWLKGDACVFPIGTYWLRRNSCAPVEQPATATVFLH